MPNAKTHRLIIAVTPGSVTLPTSAGLVRVHMGPVSTVLSAFILYLLVCLRRRSAGQFGQEMATFRSVVNAVDEFFSKLSRQRPNEAVFDALDECIAATEGYFVHHTESNARSAGGGSRRIS